MILIWMLIQTSVFSSADASTTPGEGSAMEAILSEELVRTLKDPFELPASLSKKTGVPRSDLELYQIRDFKLNGVITGPKKVRAMVSAPNGKAYFVKVGDLMGAREGRVTRITSDAIRVMEYFVNESGKRVPDLYELRINGELQALSKKEGD